MKHYLRFLLPLLVLPVLLISPGCSTIELTKAYPVSEPPATVKVVDDAPKKAVTLLPGTVFDPESRIAIVGHAKGKIFARSLGLAATAITDSINDERGRRRLGLLELDAGYDMLELARQQAAEKLSADPLPAVTLSSSAGGVLELAPYAALVFDKKTATARLYAMVSLALKSDEGATTNRWSGRYTASGAGTYHLGPTGWTSDANLQQDLSTALARAIDVALDDVGGSFEESDQVGVSGYIGWSNAEYRRLPGVVLDRTETDTVVRLILGDQYPISGTHVFRRGEVEIEPMAFADLRNG